jgi:hypothetical protein
LDGRLLRCHRLLPMPRHCSVFLSCSYKRDNNATSTEILYYAATAPLCLVRFAFLCINVPPHLVCCNVSAVCVCAISLVLHFMAVNAAWLTSSVNNMPRVCWTNCNTLLHSCNMPLDI